MFATIRAKLLGISLFSLFAVAIAGGVGYYQKYELSSQAVLEKGNMQLLNDSAKINALQEGIRADAMQILREVNVGNTPIFQDSLKALNGHTQNLKINLSAISQSTVLSEGARQMLVTMQKDAESFSGIAMGISSIALDDPVGVESRLSAFYESYNKFKLDLAGFNTRIDQDAEGGRRDTEISSTQAEYIFIGGVSAAFLLLIIVSYLVHKGIMRPFIELRNAIVKVEQGNYEFPINLDSKDEVGALGRAYDKLINLHITTLKTTAAENERLNNSVIGLFSAMGALSQKDLTVRAPVTEDIIGTLGDAINQLTDVTATVLHHVTKVVGVVEAASERMKNQSDVVNEMAKEEDVIVARLISNLETAMASIGEVAIFARDSNRAAAEATKSTESAMQTVQATLSGMDAIRETISEMEKRIKRLGERSQEISQIVNLINTISERTHVLSLNAAMQAAMAGEAGRGFAVVAEEVQRLAENSRQATGQIANLVQNIQVETNDTIATVNKTIEQVVNESELAHDAGERMRETHESTARLVRLVATIATSSAEQTKIASVLRSAADEIAQFTEKTSEQLVSQNQSATSLVLASQKLVEAISVFKLPQIESVQVDDEGESNNEKTQIFDSLDV